MDSLVGTYWISPADYSWVVESEERDDQQRNWVTLRNLQSGDTIARKRQRMLNSPVWTMTTQGLIRVTLPYPHRS